MTALEAADVTWDLSDLATDEDEVVRLLDEAQALAEEIASTYRGKVASLDGAGLLAAMQAQAKLDELVGRAYSYASLRFAADTVTPANGALQQKVQERYAKIGTTLVFFNLEWTQVDDDRATELLATPGLEFAAHHLDNARKYRDHQLSEPEEKILVEKSVTGRGAWSRLFSEQTSSIEVTLDGKATTLEEGLSRLQHPDREVRAAAAAAVTEGLKPGLRTRAFIFNTLLQDKAVDDRLRKYEHWVASRNLANEASDESVEALIEACRKRFDIPQRWYGLKARILGLERIADYDRMASVASSQEVVPWAQAKELVIDCYNSFSPQMAEVARLFFDKNWIDAPARPGKRGGAFCSYTVPSVHPYVLLNYTATSRDVQTLAHELGHGIHAYLAREQGPFQQSTPLTVAETASVFGETVVFGRLLDEAGDDPAKKLALLAENIEDNIATIFRQITMNRFEHAVHTARRGEGELSVERFGDLWAETQTDMLGDAVEITEGYRTWWSYIPHFIGSPGYVYAYAYGQLLALSVYSQYEEQGSDFVPRYLKMLATGGSVAPEELGKIVGCDLTDPQFWDKGLALVEARLEQAETAAHEAGRLSA